MFGDARIEIAMKVLKGRESGCLVCASEADEQVFSVEELVFLGCSATRGVILRIGRKTGTHVLDAVAG
jgi:hypothetical protein